MVIEGEFLTLRVQIVANWEKGISLHFCLEMSKNTGLALYPCFFEQGTSNAYACADISRQQVVGTASLIVERKFLRGCGKVSAARFA
jgi:hypothetical protein